MYYGEIKNCDIANGSGVRVSLFVSGCRNRCEHCFQKQTWDFEYGRPFTEETENSILKMLEPSYIEGLTILGGEPFEPENQIVLCAFVEKVRASLPGKNIWAYTGFTLEELFSKDCRAHCSETAKLLSMIDVLVDGRFVEEKKDISLRFRGSSNQRLIDLPQTLKGGRVVCLE